MQDLISRQAAIDAIRGWVNKAFEDWGNATTEIQCFNAIYPLIMALPSAQPDLDSAYTEGYTAAESKYREMWDEMPKIVYCRECMHREYCFSDVAMTNRSQTSTIYESIEYCSKGERRTDATTI